MIFGEAANVSDHRRSSSRRMKEEHPMPDHVHMMIAASP
jgi:hypothetical protein